MDIGYGDGAITNSLAERYQVIGVDRSEEALKHLSVRALPVISGADCLALQDKCADLVLSSEMLEHLPDGIFDKALSEIKRVSKSYILIAVPNKEKLRKRYTKCNACGFKFHIYCHLRAFSSNTVIQYFHGYTIKFSTLCGVLEAHSFDIISRLKNKLANSYFVVEQPILCPNCGNVLSFSFKRNLVQGLILYSLHSLQHVLNFLLNKKPEPYWLLALLQRDS